MPLYFITGPSGSGKSTIAQELKRRGYEAYDTDDDGLARWQNVETGYIHPKSSIKAVDRTQEFLNNHSWNVPPENIQNIINKKYTGSIFILGAIGNENELKDLFSRGFLLLLSDKELVTRLQSRTNNDWGKQAHELELTLKAKRQSEERWRRLGYIEIDAAQSINHVVDDIISEIL